MTSDDFGLLDPLDAGEAAGSAVADPAWLQALVDVEVALLHALRAAELVPAAADRVAAGIAHASDLDGPAIASAARGGGNPVIPLVKQLGARAESIESGASDWIHVGATSQDILDSAAMLVGRRAVAAIGVSLRELVAQLAVLAELHRGTPMAGRTLGQHASPTSFGLVVAGWLDGILDSLARLDDVASRLPLSFGGSVGTLGVLTDVARLRRPEADAMRVVDEVLADLSRRLGLRNPDIPWHSNRMPIGRTRRCAGRGRGRHRHHGGGCRACCRAPRSPKSPNASARERDRRRRCRTSATRVTSVLLVAAARRAPGLASTVFTGQVAEDQRPSGAWHAEWSALRDLERLALDASAAAASLARRLEVDVARMRSNLDLTDGLIFSERVSTILAESIGKTDAFDLVAAASREAVETHRPLQVVVSARLAGQGDDVRARVWAAFDPDAGLGAAAVLVDRVVARAKEIA